MFSRLAFISYGCFAAGVLMLTAASSWIRAGGITITGLFLVGTAVVLYGINSRS